MEENPVSESHNHPEVLSPIRNNDPLHSPEFEFWMVTNPSLPQTHLAPADELIVDGVLLPLDLVSHHPDDADVVATAADADADTTTRTSPTPTVEKETEPEAELSQPGPGPESAAVFSASKRWRDIFKRSSGVTEDKEKTKDRDKEKEMKKDRTKAGGVVASGGGVSSAAELNINIWPFSRSWSAGGNRSRTGGGSVSRKVSSAPCSRSNSAGESKSRKWPNSPNRGGGGGGIHLGRNSPVWQLRRGGVSSGLKPSSSSSSSSSSGERGGLRKEVVGKNSKSEVGASKSRGLNLKNVPMCIGYTQQLSCRSDENILLGVGSGSGVGVGDSGGAESSAAAAAGGGAVGGNKLLYLRTLFTKKVY